jgi:hypothetical protein
MHEGGSMSSYRSGASEVAREARWTFLRFLPLFLLVVVILGGLGFGARSLGLFGRTVVERKVFEHSYQRQASLDARIANDQAVLTEIERKLSSLNLDANTRVNLEAQASAARVRIATARGLQK